MIRAMSRLLDRMMGRRLDRPDSDAVAEHYHREIERLRSATADLRSARQSAERPLITAAADAAAILSRRQRDG
jgi:hypothetical protein